MEDKRFLLKWLAGNLLGQTFGGIFCCIFYPFSFSLALHPLTYLPLWGALSDLQIRLGLILTDATVGALVGATVGRLQWLVMEPQAGSARRWILLSAVIGGLGWALFWHLALPLGVAVLASLD